MESSESNANYKTADKGTELPYIATRLEGYHVKEINSFLVANYEAANNSTYRTNLEKLFNN